MSAPLIRLSDPPLDPEVGVDVVARVRAGDVQAFETLFFAYYDQLVDVARRHLGSQDASEDLVQDVFVRFWETRTQWVIRTSIRAYLFSAVRHMALNAMRHDRVAERYANGSIGAGSIGATGTWDNGANAPLLASEMATVVLRTVQALPARTQHAYLLRAEYALSYAEIGEIMGITAKAVQKLITRAKTALDAAIDAYV